MQQASPAVDYQGLYDSYWARPDRFGEHSFTDADAIAREILRTLGTGSILDVGCGMGLLVRTLLGQGVDAHGLDVSQRAVAHGNELAPGRFHLGSILQLPFADGRFDVVVSTDCLEHLHEHDVPQALRELRRVARRGVYLRLATTPDRDGHWRLTVQPRSFWEQRLFEAGFRKHPRAMAIVPYERLEHDEWQITLAMESLPDAALQRWPLAKLAAERDLHMDMLREHGRRADAHVARYHLAAGYVRPGDVVLDVACGLGYGSAVLAANTEAAQVIGVDLDEGAARYANDTTGACWPQATFRAGDATRLSFLADRSVDFIASFETLEHVPDPAAVLAEFARVLKPSGRVLVSVPNQWVDETGRDPNPHHLHVYDWERLRTEVAERFLPEAVWAQTAGGGMKLGDQPRRIVAAPLRDPTATPAEWWLLLAMRSPLGAGRDGYRETSYPVADEARRPNVTAFARDYDNPWLVKAIVARGHRATDPDLLDELAAAVLEEASPASADAGAALCVVAYRALQDAALPAARADELLRRIEDQVRAPAANPNVFRWQVSLLFAAARLQLWCGRRDEAAATFRRCAGLDAKAYGAILGTKTVDALLQAGLLAAADGDLESARADWAGALRESNRLLQGDWSDFLGSDAAPVAFGLPEAADLLDLAARAAYGLVALQGFAQRPGRAWESLQHGMRPRIAALETAVADLRGWSSRLLEMIAARTAEAESERGRSVQRVEDVRLAMRAEIEHYQAELTRAGARHAELQARFDQLTFPRVRGALRRLFGGVRRIFGVG